MKREVPLFIALALSAGAQAPSNAVRFQVPQLGYVYDGESKAIRLVTGVPGAAVLETSVDTGGEAMTRAWISKLGWALTQGKADSGLRYFDWSRSASRVVADSGAPVTAVAISANGRYFAFASADGSVEVWDTSASGPLRLAKFSAAGEAVRSVAVSNDASAVLSVTASGASLWRQGKQQQQQLWSGAALRGADFIAGASSDYAAFDQARGKLLIVRDGSMTEIDADAAVAPSAQAFALSADGRLAVLGGDSAIQVIDLASGSSTLLAVDAPVEELTRTANGDVLQVRFRGDAASRTALLEWTAGLASPQIEVLTGGGAQ